MDVLKARWMRCWTGIHYICTWFVLISSLYVYSIPDSVSLCESFFFSPWKKRIKRTAICRIKFLKQRVPPLYSLIVHILHWNTNFCFRDTSDVFLWLRKPMARGPHSHTSPWHQINWNILWFKYDLDRSTRYPSSSRPGFEHITSIDVPEMLSFYPAIRDLGYSKIFHALSII